MSNFSSKGFQTGWVKNEGKTTGSACVLFLFPAVCKFTWKIKNTEASECNDFYEATQSMGQVPLLSTHSSNTEKQILLMSTPFTDEEAEDRN